MNLKEALKLHRFEGMKRRGLPHQKPPVDYQRLNYYAYERYMTRIEKQNERLISAVEKIANKQAEPVVTPPCKGMNCGAIDGRSHSLECRAEHSAAIAGGRFVPLEQAEPVADDGGNPSY